MEQRKPMTLEILKKIVDKTLEEHPAHKDLIVGVYNNNEGVSGSGYTPVIVAGRGFDWYSSKFLFSTQNPMIELKEPSKPPPPKARRIKEFPDYPKPTPKN